MLLNEWGEKHIVPEQVERSHEDNSGHVCTPLMTIEVLFGKWKPLIIMHLLESVLRFTELEKLIPNINKGTLTLRLGELEEEGIIHRHICNEVPPRVEYSMTDYGESLRPLLEQLSKGGAKHFK